MQIAPGVYLIPSMVVNRYLIVEDNGLTLIDAGLPSHVKSTWRYMSSLGYAPGDLRRVLITHADGDHVGGVAGLKAASGALIYASLIEAEAIRAGRLSRELKLNGVQKRLMAAAGSAFMKAQPVRVDQPLRDGQLLPVLGGLRVVETPGHTPGHVSFFSPSAGILFAGDSLRSRHDRLYPSAGMNTWDEERAVAAARSQAALDAAVVCTGHGPVVYEAGTKYVLK